MNIPGQAGSLSSISISMNVDYYLGFILAYGWPESKSDDITFSSVRIVPEPSSIAIVSFFSVALVGRRASGPFIFLRMSGSPLY
jgi:hypothetical protein